LKKEGRIDIEEPLLECPITRERKAIDRRVGEYGKRAVHVTHLTMSPVYLEDQI
jgi:hypothetical protein